MRFWFAGPRLFAGFRPGVSFGPEDFRSARQTRGGANAIDPDHSFLYVIKNDANGLCKIGRTTYPNARLAKLQNEFTARLEFAWLGAPKEQTIAIEAEAHRMLDKYRRNGEWFAVSADCAVGAIHSAAYRRGQPCLDLTVEQAEQIRLIACQQSNKPSTTTFSRVAEGLFQLLAAFIIAGAVLVFLMFRFGRLFF
jgi:hypothetical protein